MTLEQANKEVGPLGFYIRKADYDYQLISEYNMELYYANGSPDHGDQLSEVLNDVVATAKHIARQPHYARLRDLTNRNKSLTKWAVKLYWENESDAHYEEDLDNQEEVFLTTRDETKMHYVHTYLFDTEAEKDAFVMGVNDARRYGQCIIFEPGGEVDTIIERDVSKLL